MTFSRTQLACGLAFTIGWADVVCMLRFGAFGTMMTGNAIFLARSLGLRHWDEVQFFSLTIAFYVVGVLVYRALDYCLDHRTSAMALAPIVVFCFLMVDLLGYYSPTPIPAPTPNLNRWHVWPVAVAMGAVNAVSMNVDGVVTNSITGNVMKVTLAAFDRCVGIDHGEDHNRQMLLTLGVILSLLAGVLCSASVNAFTELLRGLHMIPVAVAFAMLLWMHDYSYATELKETRNYRRALSSGRLGQAASLEKSHGSLDESGASAAAVETATPPSSLQSAVEVA